MDEPRWWHLEARFVLGICVREGGWIREPALCVATHRPPQSRRSVRPSKHPKLFVQEIQLGRVGITTSLPNVLLMSCKCAETEVDAVNDSTRPFSHRCLNPRQQLATLGRQPTNCWTRISRWSNTQNQLCIYRGAKTSGGCRLARSRRVMADPCSPEMRSGDGVPAGAANGVDPGRRSDEIGESLRLTLARPDRSMEANELSRKGGRT